jgi:hypothetical protein
LQLRKAKGLAQGIPQGLPNEKISYEEEDEVTYFSPSSSG